jgi:hypothetical protein
MSNVLDDAIRIEAVAALTAIETGVAKLREVFRHVANGHPLDPQHAENLAATCGALLSSIDATKNGLRMSTETTAVH